MALHVMPFRATSSATDLVSPATPCFAAQYGALKGDATLPWKDEMLMILPQPVTDQVVTSATDTDCVSLDRAYADMGSMGTAPDVDETRLSGDESHVRVTES